jgi:hypothetical protein
MTSRRDGTPDRWLASTRTPMPIAANVVTIRSKKALDLIA